MGKIPYLTREQTIILDGLKRSNYIRSRFYFTGGTVLSSFYLAHRYSDDLDFFSGQELEQNTIFNLMRKLGQENNFKVESRFAEVVYSFFLTFTNTNRLKVDFANYICKLQEPQKNRDGISIDSLLDIATNKLLTINQRSDVKDFVDLFFLQKYYTIWDLIPRVKLKFDMEIDPLLLSADFLKVEDFKALPRMIKPLTLSTLKAYFRKRAVEISGKVVK